MNYKVKDSSSESNRYVIFKKYLIDSGINLLIIILIPYIFLRDLWTHYKIIWNWTVSIFAYNITSIMFLYFWFLINCYP